MTPSTGTVWASLIGIVALGCSSSSAGGGASVGAAGASAAGAGSGGAAGGGTTAGGGGGAGAPAGSGGAGGTDPTLPSGLFCVGSVTPPVPAGTTISLGVTFYDYVVSGANAGAGAPITAPLSVLACGKTDTGCTAPVDIQTLNGKGVATFTLPTGQHGWDGYFQIDGMGYGPELTYLSGIVADTAPANIGRGVLKPSDLAQIATALSATIDPGRGHVVVRPKNCIGANAAGIAIEVESADGNSVYFYNDATGPSASATVTGSSALGGVLNVPPGMVTVHARYGPGGKEVMTGTAYVRAGAVTVAPLVLQ